MGSGVDHAVGHRRLPRFRSFPAAALLASTLALPATTARADDEPWLLTLEGSAALPVAEPTRSLFGPGGSGAIGVHRALAPWMLVGVRLRGILLLDGDAPAEAGRADPGLGGVGMLTGGVRFRPIPGAGPERGDGLFVDLAGGGAYTGDLLRAGAEGGVGFGFQVGPVALAPAVRYVYLHQPNDPQALDDRDAHLLLAGIELVLFDARPEPAAVRGDEGAADRDLDGILDDDDACPDVPEDPDGFEDADGCPDPDNDGDSILDADDGCPDDPEDFDGFEDADGCPDPDNDGDGVLDGDDQCPEEAEVVNGVEDQDGCPDEGLIRMVDDRIVLEERVLFDFERARLRWQARPIVQAIIELYRQNPDWAEIQIEGHADVRGREEYNQRLSEQRARNVMEALVDAGLPREMVSAVGYGSSRPRDLRESEEAHQRNRRVEFVVLARHSDRGTLAASGAGEETVTGNGPGAAPAADEAGGAEDVDGPEPQARGEIRRTEDRR